LPGKDLPLENALNFLRALAQLRAAPPVTIIFGPHAFLREYALEALRRRLAGEGFAYRSFQIGAGDSYRTITNELNSADLFAPKRLVVGRILRSYRERGGDDDADVDGSSSGPDTGGEASLIGVFERLDASVRLALVYERDKLGVRMRRAVEKTGTMVNCMRPFDNQIRQYAETFARNLSLKITANQADLLAEQHAGDLAAIANTLSKATIVAGPGGRLDPAESSGDGPARIPELFEIAESLTRGNAGETLALYDRAIQCGRDPIDVLALELIPQVRRMLAAASLAARKKDPAQIASAMGAAPNSLIVARAIEGARRFGVARLTRAHQRACELDVSFKMGLLKERPQAVAALILELMAGNAYGRR
jgi:DNA polymerase III delta subunit